MVLTSLCLRCKVTIQYISTTQVVTCLKCRDISWSITIFQAQCPYSSNHKLIVSHLNFMWCLTTSYSQFCLWSNSKEPLIRNILCDPYHKKMHQKIFNSKIYGSLHILMGIPEKLKDKNQALFLSQGIKKICSHQCHMIRSYMKVHPER